MSARIGNGTTGVSPAQHSALRCLMLALAGVIAISALLATPALAQDETVIYSFAGPPDGEDPGYNIIRDSAGNLYGVTPWGGGYTYGTAYELSPENGVWAETILHSFGGPGDGLQPGGGLVMDKAGNLYGVTSSGNGTVYELTPDGQGNWTETILKTFSFGADDPGNSLTLDASGRLYGGAAHYACCGLVYRLTPPTKKGKPWKYSVLYTTKGFKHKDGSIPSGDFVFDANGNLYGATWQGGAYNWGTVFELSPAPRTWKEKILYSFQGQSDGSMPTPGLTFDASGNLYGTTYSGGNYGVGTVYELSPGGGGWTETVLYSFTGLSDGNGPASGVTFRNRSLYGTAESGGSPNCRYGCGVVFELSPSGGVWTEQVLHAFTSVPDGATPYGGVVFDPGGNLYGTTGVGGIPNPSCSTADTTGCGVVYEVSP